MKHTSKSGIVGATLIGLGCGLTAMGIALVIPACTNWTLDFVEQAFRKSREGAETAAGLLGGIAGKAHHHFGEAAKTAKETTRATTAKAAGAVENAARQVREFAS
ncbi:MAG TPA: hypothetical protein VGL97_20580 [Bryobacteraceae bacterium]|jgi:hypothetical protein